MALLAVTYQASTMKSQGVKNIRETYPAIYILSTQQGPSPGYRLSPLSGFIKLLLTFSLILQGLRPQSKHNSQAGGQ